VPFGRGEVSILCSGAYDRTRSEAQGLRGEKTEQECGGESYVGKLYFRSRDTAKAESHGKVRDRERE